MQNGPPSGGPVPLRPPFQAGAGAPGGMRPNGPGNGNSFPNPGQFPAPFGAGMPQPPNSAGNMKPLEQQMRNFNMGGPVPGAPPPPLPGRPMNGMNGMHPPMGMPPPPFPPAANGNMGPIPVRPPPLPGMGPQGPGQMFQGPPPVPSSGTPINMPAQMGPPSTNSGMLAGIPGVRPPMGGVGGGMSGGGSILTSGLSAGPSGMTGVPPPPLPRLHGQVHPGDSTHPPPGLGMMPPPPPGGMMPPAPLSMGAPPPYMQGRQSGGQFMGGGPPPPPGPGMPPGALQSMGGPPPPGMPRGPPPPPGPPGSQPYNHPPHPQQQQQQQSSNRIDPSQIPRPAAAPLNSVMSNFDTRVGGQHVPPPPAASRYAVRDCGSSGPRYTRASLNQVPHTAELLNNTQMPFALVVSPLALPDPADEPLQVVDMGSLGPIRCSRCKAYMNPFMRFMSSGRSFTCNFCGCSNTTPDAYFCHLGPHGRRQDADERPELCKGSVEYVATSDYMVRQPMQPAHLFLIDVTQAAVTSGATATVCSCISHTLESMPNPDCTLVGIATVDSTLHFYGLRGADVQPQMLVVTDVQDVFAPSSAPLLGAVTQQKEALQKLLTSIPEIFAQTKITESCAGSAIEAAVSMLEPSGGKVHAFLSVLPSTGKHTLKVRDGMGTNAEKDKLAFLASQDNTCKTLAMTAADFQISIDIAFLSQGYVDIATFRDLVSSTGGTLYQYASFNPVMDHDQVLNDLKWNLVRPQGLEAVMRVRCSQGLDVSHYTGHFYQMPANPTDVYLPAIDSDKSILAVIQHTEKLAPGAECYLQAALLYTTLEGQRRVRVHTLALPVTDNVSTVFKGSDLDAYTSHLSRRLAGQLPGLTLASARESITSAVVSTLHAYRKYCAANSSAVQLILPESLKLLPLYALSLLKGPALKDGAKPDERALWCANMMSLPAARVTPLLYPRLLAFHQVLEAGGVEALGGLPEGLVASAESLQARGVYLLENGHDGYLYFEKGAEQSLLEDLLGVSSYEDLCRVPGNFPLLPRDNAVSKELEALLTKVRIHRSSFMRLRVARKGDPAEVAFFNGLVEDRSTAGLSYVEYLCQVHRLIQQKMN